MPYYRTIPFLALFGCSSYGADALFSGEEPTDYAGEDDDNSDPDDEDVSEQEDGPPILEPAETPTYIFIANPERDTVTRVTAATLAVVTTPVGNDPQIVKADPSGTRVAVFNRGNDSVSIIDAETLQTVEVPVRDELKQMVMSPDGDWVALWHDIASEDDDDPPAEGVQSYNEVSFIRLSTAEHFPMAVDYNPHEVQFTPDSSLAVVVTDTSLGLVDLLAEELSPNLIHLTEELVDPPVAEEVAVAEEGTYAFVRQFGVEEILVVDLATEVVTPIDVGQNPTDIDLSPDGASAVVVSRGSEELWILDVPNPFASPVVIPLPADQGLGSVQFDPTGQRAIVYTTATLTDRIATWDLSDNSVTLRSVVKPVASAAISPTGDSLILFHTHSDAAGADTNSPFYGEWALTLIDFDDFRQNPIRLPAEPIGFANSSNGRYGYFIMEGERYLEAINYGTLLVDEIPIKSDPVFVGALADPETEDEDEPPAWVSQAHDLGRISFYDPDNGELATVTGFELNSAIED